MIEQAAALLRQSSYTVVLTGAGISTPSGIPDFRSSKDGIWEKYDPMYVASLASFRVAPQRVFDWMRPLAITMFNAQPNPAHIALAELEEIGRIQEIITQNIDGLHKKAGSKVIHEIHGSMSTLTCVSCFTQFPAQGHIHPYIDEGLIPACPDCDNILKPDVILFGEQLPIKTWEASTKAINACELLIVVGSSLEVTPVAGLPVHALNHGAHLMIINNDPTYIDSRADLVFNNDVVDILPMIANEFKKSR
ncbi:MAG: NAD-dependent deacylase [Anaerolineae bacterium]|nr:NAD-dependent deacylase [Anaerolineae bacterium]